MRQFVMKEIKPRNIRYYVDKSGKIPCKEWLDGLKDSTIRHRIRARLDRVELGNLGVYKPLSDGVLELKFNFGSGYRVYFGEQEDYFIILLCGGDKGSQKIDVETAKKYWKDFLERCDE